MTVLLNSLMYVRHLLLDWPKKKPNKTITQKSPPTGAYQGHKLMQIFFPCLFLFLEKKSKAKKSILCRVKVAITQGTMQHMKYWGWEIRT